MPFFRGILGLWAIILYTYRETKSMITMKILRALLPAARFARKKVLPAIAYLMVLLATLHFIVLLVISFLIGDISMFNIFKILSIDWFVPGINVGTMSDIISVFIFTGLFVTIFAVREILSSKRALMFLEELPKKPIWLKILKRNVPK
jgi:hypothetical protein